MRRFLLAAALLLSFGCTSTVARRADRLLARYQMYGFTGMVLIADHDRVVLDRNYGIAERAFDAGSIMKPVVAAAVLQLQDAGRLRVRDAIGRYIESLPPERAAITIEQLLVHTSGLPLDVTDGDLLATAATAPLVSRPGERYSYSNAGYGLLVLVAERAAGEPFHTYARRTLLEPAGMRETSFWGEPALPTPVSYSGKSDEELEPVPPLSHTGDGARIAGKYVFGATGLITTTRDLLRWWRFVERRPELLVERVKGQSYGWNIRRGGAGASKIYRGGLIQGSVVSLLSVYPERDTVLTWMMNKNTGWHEPVTKNFERLLAGQPYLLPPAVIGGRDAVQPEYAGAEGRIALTRDRDDLLVAAEGQALLSLLWGLTGDERVARANAEAAGTDGKCEVLGTARHPSSKARLQSFLRCGGEVRRAISEEGRIIASAPGYPKSAQRRFRRTGKGRYAMYDHELDFVVRLEVGAGAVTLRAGSSAVTLRAAGHDVPITRSLQSSTRSSSVAPRSSQGTRLAQ